MSFHDAYGNRSPMTASRDAIGPLAECNVIFYLKDVKEGIFVKYDWIFLNDRILRVRMAGIDPFLSKKIITNYTKILGSKIASDLIKRLKDLRRKRECSLTEGDVSNLLIVDKRNSDILLQKLSRVLIEGKFFGGYKLTLVGNPSVLKGDISRGKVSRKDMALYFKARVGSGLIER